MLRSIIISLLLIPALFSSAQDKFFTKTGRIEFFSRSSMEDIEAKNKSVAVVLDSKSGAMQFSVLMKGFEFEKALMQEHFNENYVESDKYPKAEFKGIISNNSSVNYAKDGNYAVKVKGRLTLHGVTRDVEAPGTIQITDGKLNATSLFNITLSDYKIKIPAVVKDKVSNNIRISVDCKMEPLKAQ